MHATQPISRTRQSGMTLLEVMFAMAVLAIGILALMTLVTTAIASNNRNKLDTTGTMLSQAVIEGIAAQADNGTFSMTDCNPAAYYTWTNATAGAGGSGAGARIDPSTANIDFTQSYSDVPANYKMLYVTCGVGGTQSTYDVRWNIFTLTTYTKYVTVAARQIAVPASGGSLPFFSPPITLRTIVGQ